MSTDPNKPGNDSESESPTEKRGGQDTFAAAAAVARSDDHDQDNRPRRFRRTTALAAGVAIAVAVAVSYFAVSRDLRITFKREPRSKAGSGSTNGSKQPVNSVSTGTIAGPRVALVIGNGKYRFVPQLANPLNDARLIAKNLREAGFNLVGGGAQLDLDKPGLEGALENFSRQLQGASVALFYYAGHGLQVGGENYLVPTSANPERESDVKLQMVDAQVILDQMQDAGARLNILILDACRNNPFGGRGLRAVTGGLAPMQAPEGTLIAYATQPGAVASDGEGVDSPYSAALGQVMLKRGLEFREALNQVGLTVSKETGGSQQPWTANSPIDGYFYFAGAPAPVSTPAVAVAVSTPSREDAEILFWQSIDNSKDPRDFAAYLKQYPAGRFSALAQVRIAELSTPKSAPSAAPEINQAAAEESEKHSYPRHASLLPSPTPSARQRQQLASIETPIPITVPNTQLSQSLSDYLHHNRLPYVDALVLSDRTGEPSSVVLSGRVLTEKGKRAAESKARDYLGAPGVTINNRITLDSALASRTTETSSQIRQAPSESTEQSAARLSCFGQCEQRYSSCAAACQAQSTAGSSGAEAGSIVAWLLGTTSKPLLTISSTASDQACTSRCAAEDAMCSQVCQSRSGGKPLDRATQAKTEVHTLK